MKRLSVLLLTWMVAIHGATAWAQRQGGRGGAPNAGMMDVGLLAQSSVQSELKLSDEQTKQVAELQQSQRGAMAGLRDLSREERQSKMAERAKSNNEAIAKILNAEQAKRFKQIVLQQRGAQALADPEVAQSLGLTSEQQDRIKAIQGEARGQLQGAGQGGDREALRTKMQEVRKATNEKALGVLTADQQTKWKELTGAPFTGEIRAPQFRGGNGAGAGRANRGKGNASVTPLPANSLFRLVSHTSEPVAQNATAENAPEARTADKSDDAKDKKDGDRKGGDKKHGDRQHGRHHRHRQHARQGGGANAQVWDRVARSMGDGQRPRAPHGFGPRGGHGPQAFHGGPPHGHFRGGPGQNVSFRQFAAKFRGGDHGRGFGGHYAGRDQRGEHRGGEHHAHGHHGHGGPHRFASFHRGGQHGHGPQHGWNGQHRGHQFQYASHHRGHHGYASYHRRGHHHGHHGYAHRQGGWQHGHGHSAHGQHRYAHHRHGHHRGHHGHRSQGYASHHGHGAGHGGHGHYRMASYSRHHDHGESQHGDHDHGDRHHGDRHHGSRHDDDQHRGDRHHGDRDHRDRDHGDRKRV